MAAPHLPPLDADAGDFRLRIEVVSHDRLDTIDRINYTVFRERRIINTFERDDLLMLLASVDDLPVGFKIGYRLNARTFYSAKGAVLPQYRQRGIARRLLYAMMDHVRPRYERFAFDTFPNKHPGMTVLALREGFRLTNADYNGTYQDYRLRFEIKL